MECERCGAEMYIDFRSGQYALWRCNLCPYMEVTSEGLEDPIGDNIENYKEAGDG